MLSSKFPNNVKMWPSIDIPVRTSMHPGHRYKSRATATTRGCLCTARATESPLHSTVKSCGALCLETAGCLSFAVWGEAEFLHRNVHHLREQLVKGPIMNDP